MLAFMHIKKIKLLFIFKNSLNQKFFLKPNYLTQGWITPMFDGSLTDSQMPVIFKNDLEIPKHQLDDVERKGPSAHQQHIEWAFLQAKETNMLKIRPFNKISLVIAKKKILRSSMVETREKDV